MKILHTKTETTVIFDAELDITLNLNTLKFENDEGITSNMKNRILNKYSDDIEGFLGHKVKYCSICNKIKNISKFSKDKSKKDGLRCYCKDCVRYESYQNN